MIELSSWEIMANLDLRHVILYYAKPRTLPHSHVALFALATDVSEKERFLNSVINALSKDESLAASKCMAQALVLRSQVLSNDNNDNDDDTSKITERLESARTDILQAAVLDPYHPTVWRILATIEEERNDHAAAIQALSKWATYQPLFLTKVQKEISRLRESTVR